MRKRLFLMLSVLTLAATIATFTPQTKSQVVTSASATDCATVNQVCDDMAAMLYNACIVNGFPPTTCAADEANCRINCKTSNGCPLPKQNDN